MAYNNSQELSFLSKTELEWLLGNKKLSGGYNRKIRSQVRKKLENFERLELPLLVEKGLIALSAVTKFGNGVTKYSNADFHSSSSTNEICAQMKKPWAEFEPATFSLPRKRSTRLSYQGTREACIQFYLL